MTTREKMLHLIDKKDGFGISTAVLAKYSGYNRTTLSHYIAGDRPALQRQENAYENGMKKLLDDMVEFWNNN